MQEQALLHLKSPVMSGLEARNLKNQSKENWRLESRGVVGGQPSLVLVLEDYPGISGSGSTRVSSLNERV